MLFIVSGVMSQVWFETVHIMHTLNVWRPQDLKSHKNSLFAGFATNIYNNN